MNAPESQPADGLSEVEALRRRLAEVDQVLARSIEAGRELQMREQQLAAHNQVLVFLSRSRAVEEGDLDKAVREITHAASQTLKVERVSVWLFDEDRQSIRCLDLYRRSSDEHSDGLTLSAPQFPAYFRAVEENRTIAADDARVDPRTREFRDSYLAPLGISSMLDAPVRSGGRLIGIICHEHVGPPRHWSLEEQAFAGSMADFVALALQAAERRRVEERRRLMIQELDHRVKNNLAAVLSVAEQTAAGSASLREFLTAFSGRIRSMAIAHEMLAQSKWEGASIHELIRRVMEPFIRSMADRFRLGGPEVMLPARMAQPVCMIVHELAINATKYGSLSTPEGRVSLRWEVSRADGGGQRLKLHWEEGGGPQVAPPTDRGFGIDLIERTCAYELKGRATFSFQPRGLRCEIDLPLPADAVTGHERPVRLAVETPTSQTSFDIDGRRVLVVEDDLLVAQSLARQLEEVGCVVVGPVPTAEEACTLLKEESIDAAVLDINLSPGTSAPVARALQYRRCPFVFVTGYSSLRNLPDDLRGQRVLAKPVDRETLADAISSLVHASPA
jgi:two-component sensor histidine kinase